MNPERMEIEILKLCMHSWLRTRDIADCLRVPPSTVSTRIAELLAAGVLRREKRTTETITKVYYRTKP